jgi:hypothetical protein
MPFDSTPTPAQINEAFRRTMEDLLTQRKKGPKEVGRFAKNPSFSNMLGMGQGFFTKKLFTEEDKLKGLDPESDKFQTKHLVKEDSVSESFNEYFGATLMQYLRGDSVNKQLNSKVRLIKSGDKVKVDIKIFSNIAHLNTPDLEKISPSHLNFSLPMVCSFLVGDRDFVRGNFLHLKGSNLSLKVDFARGGALNKMSRSVSCYQLESNGGMGDNVPLDKRELCEAIDFMASLDQGQLFEITSNTIKNFFTVAGNISKEDRELIWKDLTDRPFPKENITHDDFVSQLSRAAHESQYLLIEQMKESRQQIDRQISFEDQLLQAIVENNVEKFNKAKVEYIDYFKPRQAVNQQRLQGFDDIFNSDFVKNAPSDVYAEVNFAISLSRLIEKNINPFNDKALNQEQVLGFLSSNQLLPEPAIEMFKSQNKTLLEVKRKQEEIKSKIPGSFEARVVFAANVINELYSNDTYRSYAEIRKEILSLFQVEPKPTKFDQATLVKALHREFAEVADDKIDHIAGFMESVEAVVKGIDKYGVTAPLKAYKEELRDNMKSGSQGRGNTR